jgi:hypothetical protein
MRIDTALPKATAGDFSAYNKRAHIQQLCNDYHLNGKCSKGLGCSYDHSSIEPELLNVIRHVLRVGKL